MSSAKVQNSNESSAYPETLENNNNSSLKRDSLSEICFPKVPNVDDLANGGRDLSGENTFILRTSGIMTASPTSMSPILKGNDNYVLAGSPNPIDNFAFLQDSYSRLSPANGYPTQDYNGYPTQDYDGSPIRDYDGSPIQDYDGYPIQDYNGYPTQGYNGYPIQDRNGFPSHEIGFSSQDLNNYPVQDNSVFSPQNNNIGLGIDYYCNDGYISQNNDPSRQGSFYSPQNDGPTIQKNVYPPQNDEFARQGYVHPPQNDDPVKQGSVCSPQNNDFEKQGYVYPPQNNEFVRQGYVHPPQNNDPVKQGSVCSPQNNDFEKQGYVYPPQNNEFARQGYVYPPQNNDLVKQGSVCSQQNNDPVKQGSVCSQQNNNPVKQGSVCSQQNNDPVKQGSVCSPQNNNPVKQGSVCSQQNNNPVKQGSVCSQQNNNPVKQGSVCSQQNNNPVKQGSVCSQQNNNPVKQGSVCSQQNNNPVKQGSVCTLKNNNPVKQGSVCSIKNNNHSRQGPTYLTKTATLQNENIKSPSSLMTPTINNVNTDSGFGVCRSLCSNTRTLSDDEIKNACKEFNDIISNFNSKEEDKLIDILSKYPPIQMDQIISGYKTEYNKSLNAEIKSKTSGNFGKLCSALTKTTIDYDVWCLHNAIDGLGTDERCLIDILVGRTNKDIISMCKVYKATYNRSLEDDIKGDTSGYFKQFLVTLVQGNRDESNNERDVQADAKALFKAGEGRLGTNENEFITIFTNRSNAHLIKVFEKYQQLYKNSIIKAIKGEFSGHIKDSLLAHVRAIINYNDYVADLFEKSMKGIGTRNEMLIRLVVRYRDPALMGPIKEAYNKMYKKSLKSRIEGDTSGSFRKLLCKCIENCKPQ